MIFNTFKSDIGGFKNSFGLFGASFQQIKQYGIGSAFGKLDKNVLLQYNEAIKAGCSHTQAYNVALTDLDGNLINVNNATKKAMITANGQVIALEKINSGARASAIGMGLLNAAMNFGIMMAVQGLIIGLQWLAKEIPTVANLTRKLKETADAFKETKDEITSLNDELTTTQDRINELKAKGTLSFTEASELKRLEAENAERAHTIWLLEQENKERAKSAQILFNKSAKVDPNKDLSYFHDDKDTGNFLTDFANDYNSSNSYSANTVEAYRDMLDNLFASGYEYGSDATTDKKIDDIYRIVDAYDAYCGATNTLYATIAARPKYAKANEEIQNLFEAGNLNSESLSNLYNTNKSVKEFVDYLFSLGTTDAKNVTEFLSLLPGEFKKIEESAEDAESSFKSIAKTLSDGLDKLSNKKDILSEVKEELDSFGAISADNISKILEQFSDNDDVQKAVAYYLSGIGTAQQLYDVMAKGYQNDLKLQAQELATKMQNDEKYYEAIGGLNKSFTNWLSSNYNVDLKNCTTLAKTKLEVENSLINTFKENWGKYYKWANNISSSNINSQIAQIEKLLPKGLTNPLLTEAGRNNLINKFVSTDPIGKITGKQKVQELYTMWKQLKDIASGNNSATKELDKLISQNFNATGFNSTLSTDFDKDSGKTEAEKYFDKQKYLLETNQITQEEYLKRINKKYQEFYKKQGDDLEDYAKYSQEVYDGFKDMYKEDLEAQKEAWEKKKDAVSEYYDNLREQIEDAHDKEDYEKEQSEKRKEIFDLDMQIAELMRDGSEKAKARITELEEERLKAEEELLNFETDKAREDELSRLEKEQEAEEKKIQDKIDGIQKKLDKLDEDTISVRNAIIAYAKEKGVTLNFAYASGTRSSVGGFGRINENGIEMISAPDGNGNYIPMLPNSYVFSAKATEFLWKLATEHSLPQAMYNSIAKSIKTQSSTPSVNIAQPITITMGDVIIKGNADKQTVADIKKQQENTVRMVLQKIKELQK